MVSLTHLHFAANTPFDTQLSMKPPQGEQLLPAEVAQTVRRALARVVESGTASRLAGALKDAAGKPLTIGGKTGTGDHRFQRYGRGGQLLESRVVNRTATFVFYLGDRYFGTLTALVPGEQAGQFVFTSSLATQILKTLLPKLQPHLYPQPPEPSRLKPVARLARVPHLRPRGPRLRMSNAPAPDRGSGRRLVIVLGAYGDSRQGGIVHDVVVAPSGDGPDGVRWTMTTTIAIEVGG